MRPVTLAVRLWGIALTATFVPAVQAEEFSDLLPRLLGPVAVAERVNLKLAQVEDDLREARIDCLSQGNLSDWSQSAEITWRSAELLSVVVLADFWCEGAAHPNSLLLPMTFDLATGDEVDWQRALPPKLVKDTPNQFSLSEIEVTGIFVEAYLRQATTLPEECRAEISASPVYFQFWLDREDRGLIALPTSVSYAMQACSDPLAFPVPALRALGISGRIPAALSEGDE